MKSLDYVVTSSGVDHVARYAVETVERAMDGLGLEGRSFPNTNKTARRIYKYLYKAGLVRPIIRSEKYAVLVPMMGLLEWTIFPWAYYTETVPLVFDCMPNQFDLWAEFFRRNRVSMAFFTAEMAVDHFTHALPGGKWLWLPEAIDTSGYSASTDWGDRNIDVLEFGRRYDRYHSLIKDSAQEIGWNHLYEREKGRLIFATKADFISGLSRSKISVCFPQSETHPERFGAMETLTQRYLESMVSGCILVGRAPQELIKLFGYDPVIPIDWAHPAEQLRRIIERPEDHESLRIRNLSMAKSMGDWKQRAAEFAAAMREHGYRVNASGSE